MLKKWIGDKAFYKMVLAIAIPIIIQNAITNIVSLIDNVMVGNVGTLEMSGVSIANQLLNVYTLAMFGGVNAVGLFLAQYAGKKNQQGIKNCFVLKIYISFLINLLFIAIFLFFGKDLIASYLKNPDNSFQDNLATLHYGWTYLVVMLVSLFPFGLKEALASTLRELGQTLIPMSASSIAIVSNAILNYILIFGHIGFPALGIVGAAIATVISRFLELIIIFVFAYRRKQEFTFLIQPWKGLTIDFTLIKNVIKRGAPLAFNEVLWSASIAGITQCYSTRGLEAVAALTILNTLNNVYCIVCNSLGVALSIIVGQILGREEREEAIDTNRKIIVFSLFLSSMLAVIFFYLSPLFPQLYKTSDQIKQLATILLQITALKLPIQAIYMCCYFTLRSGGKTVLTFFFDSFSSAAICWPLAFFLANFTSLPLVSMYVIISLLDLIKAILGIALVKSEIWINTLVS